MTTQKRYQGDYKRGVSARIGMFIAYWKKRVTPERLREKLQAEFGENALLFVDYVPKVKESML